MVTGSVASSLQGEPRSTHDIDLVVELGREGAAALLAAFPEPDYYLSPEAMREAMATRGMFNLLDARTGDKVDFWMLTDDPFDRSRFARRITERVEDMELTLSTPEDTILAKLSWAKQAGGSTRQMHDVLRVYEVQRPTLDIAYIGQWADRLGVRDLWERTLRDASEA